MNKLQRFLLKYIFKQLFHKPYAHLRNVEQVYELIREVWEDEFMEDSAFTTDEVLDQSFQNTQYKSFMRGYER